MAGRSFSLNPMQDVKESVAPRVESATTYATEKGDRAKDTALEKSQQGYTIAKDTLLTAGKTTTDYTKQKAEQAMDYTGRKKEEAQQELAAKKSPETKGECGGKKTRSAMAAQGKEEMSPRGTEHKSGSSVGGVLEAVGETVLEIAQATKELVIGMDLNLEQRESAEIFVDNQAAIAISHNPVFHGKTKHFNIKLFFLREVQKKEFVSLVYCKSEDQLVDLFTKSLPISRFEFLRQKLGVRSS